MEFSFLIICIWVIIVEFRLRYLESRVTKIEWTFPFITGEENDSED